VLGFFKRRRREKTASRPFPDTWLRILRRNVAYYARLTPAEQTELRRHIQIFVAEKNFEGCGGLTVTDEVKVTIAAQACLLLLNRSTDYYPGLLSIVVYPNAFVTPVRHTIDGGVQVEGEEVKLGESWGMGTVVLSWEDVLYSSSAIDDGENVVLHEFAHQLDNEDGEANGVPRLSAGGYRTWAKVLSREYEQLIRDVERHRPTVLDEYGAEDPAEFFAVLTETFFESPHELKEHHPELYRLLQEFYRQDPVRRFD
jgi:MtfA peptidase